MANGKDRDLPGIHSIDDPVRLMDQLPEIWSCPIPPGFSLLWEFSEKLDSLEEREDQILGRVRPIPRDVLEDFDDLLAGSIRPPDPHSAM